MTRPRRSLADVLTTSPLPLHPAGPILVVPRETWRDRQKRRKRLDALDDLLAWLEDWNLHSEPGETVPFRLYQKGRKLGLPDLGFPLTGPELHDAVMSAQRPYLLGAYTVVGRKVAWSEDA